MESLVDKRMYSQNPYNSKKKIGGLLLTSFSVCLFSLLGPTYLVKPSMVESLVECSCYSGVANRCVQESMIHQIYGIFNGTMYRNWLVVWNIFYFP